MDEYAMNEDAMNDGDDINEDWINEIEEDVELYDMSCYQDIDSMGVVIIYLKEDEICFVRKETISIKKSVLDQNNIINLVMRFKKHNNTIYRVKHFFSYNFNLDNVEEDTSVLDTGTIKQHSLHKSIVLHKTIQYFQNLNTLYFVMEEQALSKNTTRRVFVSVKNKTRRK
tara:strand:+ start:126 stop:635 length:510 start_codon:yes stop_codon:yes gene_type:complete